MKEIKELKNKLKEVKTSELPLGLKNKVESLLKEIQEEELKETKEISFFDLLTDEELDLLIENFKINKTILGKLIALYFNEEMDIPLDVAQKIVEEKFFKTIERNKNSKIEKKNYSNNNDIFYWIDRFLDF